jgi:Glycosyltransferase 61
LRATIPLAQSQQPYPLHSLKKDLKRERASEAFGEYRRVLGFDETVALQETTASCMNAAAPVRAKFYLESDAGGQTFVNRAPKVLGEGNHRDLSGVSRASYVACFENARVWSFSASIELDDAVVFDFESWELAQVEDDLWLDPRVFHSEGQKIWYVKAPRRQPDRHIARAFMLTGVHTQAFGHWIWEYLPKYASALNAGCLPPLAVLIDKDMPPSHREGLVRMLAPGHEIVEIETGACVRVDELWCAPALFYMPLFERMDDDYRADIIASPVSRFLPAIARMSAGFSNSRPTERREGRLYFARRDDQHRRLLNRVEIEAIARSRGFEIIYPETLSLAEQVHLVRSAGYIMGPEGSSGFLGYYALPETKYAILNHTYTALLPTLTAVLEGLGLEVTVITGPIVKRHEGWIHFSHYTIPPETFESFLNSWLD